MPVLGALGAVAGPEAEDVALTLEADTDDGVDGPVGDLAVPDLDPDRVNEDHRIDGVERPRLPSRHLLEHGIGDPRDRVLRDLGPYTSWKWARAISPVVRPFAASEITSSSTPRKRRCRLRHGTGHSPRTPSWGVVLGDACGSRGREVRSRHRTRGGEGQELSQLRRTLWKGFLRIRRCGTSQDLW